ncbi:MAG: tRNA dihydrouridine(20/20a) synthase DusA [Marinagarivorans sp.]|nr:tRNA dihydrouridine(20/20a) synthase DusA [Marinagarivorans sp.]
MSLLFSNLSTSTVDSTFEPRQSWRFCTAPMMDWSDRHCRYLWRLLSKNTRLYTEMVTTPALIHGDRERFLAFDKSEHPVALQLGGSNIYELVESAKMAEQAGFDEVNLNCGCPSDRVQENKIGACLMAHPQLVADCISAMQNAVAIPVTIKHRTGIDDLDSEEQLHHFVSTVAQSGCKVFIVHARKAWLNGLSPKENREIPPLQYERVYALKKAFPELTIVSNGGIKTTGDSLQQLQYLDGVMIGREAYHNPFLLASVDNQIYGQVTNVTRTDVFAQYLDYCHYEFKKGTRLHHITRHILGLYHGEPGGRLFRRYISENACKKDADPELLLRAIDAMRRENAV